MTTLGEFEYELTRAVAARPRVRYVRIPYRFREFEAELFDPQPPNLSRLVAGFTHFASGRATLTAAHRRTIARLAQWIVRRLPSSPVNCLYLRVVGHEDELGDPVRYGVLGEQRAQAVAVALANRVVEMLRRMPAASRPGGRLEIQIESRGPTEPMRSNITHQGRAINRRVELHLRDVDVDLCSDQT